MGNDAEAPHPAPRELPPVAAGIRAWSVNLAATPDAIAGLLTSLSAPERARLARFGTEALGARYIIGRATLRLLLGRRLGIAPSEVPIRAGARGRPELAGIDGIDFNVSHTQGAGLIAIAQRAPASLRVGVDIECLDRRVGADRLARKFLCARERDALTALDEDARRRRFLRLWTCKEAMSKATGDGLIAPFAKLAVELPDGPRLVAGPGRYAPADWRLHAVTIGLGLIATIAVWTPGGSAR